LYVKERIYKGRIRICFVIREIVGKLKVLHDEELCGLCRPPES
jgi:hypothetical protein